MRKFRLPLNLQLFADEDAILPDDFVDTPATETPVDTNDTGFDDPIDTETEDTTPVEAQADMQETVQGEPDFSPLLKAVSEMAKFNHGSVQVNSIDELVANFQKGLVMDKAVERARQEAAQQARDEVIASMGYEWNGQKITTEADYKRAVQEKELLDKYSQLPPELAQELIESRRDREERQREKLAKEEEEKHQADFNDFTKYFESVNDRRWDPQKDKFPEEVLAAVTNGQPLKSAYMEFHNKELRNQLKIAIQNQENLKRAPVGSVTAGGGTRTEAKDPFLQGFDEE